MRWGDPHYPSGNPNNWMFGKDKSNALKEKSLLSVRFSRKQSNKRKQHYPSYASSLVSHKTHTHRSTKPNTRIISGENFTIQKFTYSSHIFPASKLKWFLYKKTFPNGKDRQSNKNFSYSCNPKLQQFHGCSKRSHKTQIFQQHHSQAIKHSEQDPTLYLVTKKMKKNKRKPHFDS